MSGLWDAQQREWLQAMGYSVLSLAGDEPAAAAMREEPDAGRAREAAPVREAQRPAASERGGSARGDAGRGSPQAAAAQRQGADSALLAHLLRAARRPAGDAEVLALFDPAALRLPAAKRALWPRLRALRRAGARG